MEQITLRRPEYLSPTALTMWKKNKEEYFLKYLTIDRPPPFPQTDAMSVGSSFDAYVKSFLYAVFYKGGELEGQFEFDTIFTTQVEEQHRDFALAAGADVFSAYKASGALNDLVRMLQSTGNDFTMETTERSSAVGSGVVLLGKPDLVFTLRTGQQVVLDWKVNGYCSKNGARPIAGYVDYRDGKGTTKTVKGSHKNVVLEYIGDYLINGQPNIETSQKDWANQLCTYGWVTGVQVGDPLYVAVDQLVCTPSTISVAKHRCEITQAYQEGVYAAYEECWSVIQSDHIFRDRSFEESDDRCRQLLMQSKAFQGDDANTKWLRGMAGRA